VDLDADAAFDDTGDATYYQGDGVHFTVAGRTIIANLIVAEISP
jgi:lysophospholipase L1-like esterase